MVKRFWSKYRFIVLSLICLYFSCCTNKINVKALNLIVNYPVITFQAGNLKHFDLLDTVVIYYKDNYVLYRLSPNKNLENNKNIPGSESFFLYQTSSKTGTFYNSSNDTDGVSANVDSVLLNRAYTGLTISFTDSSWFKADSIHNNQCMLEKYAPLIVSKDPNSVDSAFFYYTNSLDDFEYTFSKTNDARRKMKMYKIRLLYNAKFSEKEKAAFPKREIFYEIQKRDITEADSISKGLFDKYFKKQKS